MHREVVRARGHGHVAGTHASTVEVTADDYLTPAGDCIVGIEADRTPADFGADFVAACQRTEARIEATFVVDGLEDRLVGRGHPDLTFESDRSLVGRTSEYVDDRTIAVGMDGAARDLDREIIDRLVDGESLELTLGVE